MGAHAPRMSSNAPHMSSNAPHMSSNAPRMSSNAPQMSSNAPRMSSNAPQMSPAIGAHPGRSRAHPTAPRTSPTHQKEPRLPYLADHRAATMVSAQEWLASKSLPFPVPQSQFDQTVVEFLRAEPANADLVGLDDSQPPRVTFVRAVDLQAKFAHKGEAAIALLSDPILVLRYKAEWEAWLANLPAAVRTSAPPAGMTGAPRLPPSSQSPLRFGLSRCAKWSALSTEMAFFSSVQTALSVTPCASTATRHLRTARALCPPRRTHAPAPHACRSLFPVERAPPATSLDRPTLTPIPCLPLTPPRWRAPPRAHSRPRRPRSMFSMGAIALFTRSLIISYVALYCLVGMILTLLGLMHLLSIPLGVTSALALGLVIGMSVDYIIHLAGCRRGIGPRGFKNTHRRRELYHTHRHSM